VKDVEVVEKSRLKSSIRTERVTKQHLDVTDVTDHASHLAENIEMADDRLESRLKSTFDHEVGHLDHDTVTDDAPPPIFGKADGSDAIGDLVRMLRSPIGIRNAVLLKEILNRPDFDSFDEKFDE
jgi:hypothetical protein